MTDTWTLVVANSTGNSIDIYSTMADAPSQPPSADPSAYAAVYTLLGTVADGATGSFNSAEPALRVVVVRTADQFPIVVRIASPAISGSEQITVAGSDVTTATSGWVFYQAYASQPFAPTSLNFAALVSNTQVGSLVDAAVTFFNQNGAAGVTFGLFSAIGYWATNQLYAFPGTYTCYEPPAGSSMGFILPTSAAGTLAIAGGAAIYTAADGSATVPLAFVNGTLSSSGANSTIGLQLTAILHDLSWEGQPGTTTWGFVGTNDGQQFIAQSYADPKLPWYAVAFDLAYGAFFTVQLAMALDAAISLLGTVANGLQWLGQNAGSFADSIRVSLNSTADTAGSGSAAGDSADPVNVDIDIDIDIDVDIDIDIDVDTDVDVDVDVDFVAVVDVDVDVDVDIDVVTDTDIDIDIDVDTDVDVQPGAIPKLLSSVGNWIMAKALPTLIEGVVIYVAFRSVGAILDVWRQADENDIANLQPSESTGLGLLINYMLQDSLTVETRWTTFSQYVTEVQGDPDTVSIALATLLQTANSLADTEAMGWKWSAGGQAGLMAAMAPFTGSSANVAFQTLATATDQGRTLPIKTGAATAIKYLAAQASQ